MIKICQALTLIILLNSFFNELAHAQSQASANIRNISLFRNEIQLDFDSKTKIKVGSKFTAQTSVKHKCLLIVKKIIKDLAYADATQCPGYATLKKGQAVTISADDEVNEEIRVATPEKNEDT